MSIWRQDGAREERTMTDAIEALAADRAVLLRICAGLTDDDWKAASGCPGWSVQDVVTHMGAGFQAMIDPAALPDTQGLPFERAQDVIVQARRGLRPDEVVAHYEEVSAKALGVLADLAGADFGVPLGDAGTYPASLLPAGYGFDHYTHIRADLFAPRGPLAGPPPAADAPRVGYAIDWVEAAIGQQNQPTVTGLAGAAEIVLSGADSRTIRVGPGGPAAASVHSDAEAFLRWITQRATWEQAGVQASGDQSVLAAVRQVRVF
jgi:uncharacterized protein (TIGR03083 family)